MVSRLASERTPASPSRLSWEEYLRTEDPPGFRLEFEEGRLIVSPTGVNRHQQLVKILAAVFDDYEERTGGRHCLASVDTSHFMPPGERDFRPDIGVISAARKSGLDPDGWIQGAPDIAIEVLSPSTRQYDLGPKARRYFERGTSEYWQFDAGAERVVFLRRGAEGWREVRLGRRRVYTSPLLPGFKLDLDRLWKRLARKLGRKH